jgi:hypothetical protein
MPTKQHARYEGWPICFHQPVTILRGLTMMIQQTHRASEAAACGNNQQGDHRDGGYYGDEALRRNA